MPSSVAGTFIRQGRATTPRCRLHHRRRTQPLIKAGNASSQTLYPRTGNGRILRHDYYLGNKDRVKRTIACASIHRRDSTPRRPEHHGFQSAFRQILRRCAGSAARGRVPRSGRPWLSSSTAVRRTTISGNPSIGIPTVIRVAATASGASQQHDARPLRSIPSRCAI